MSLIPAAVAGTAAAGAYLNAKYHIYKDLRGIWNLKMSERRLIKAVRDDKVCLWPYFEDEVKRLPENEQCIWSRDGEYTWRETYTRSNQYSQFLLHEGVNSRDIVGFYLTNTPEFVFSTLGVWAIGCAPAFINHHLAGDALVHCTRISGTKILIVDWDEECQQRIEEQRTALEEIGIKIFILNDKLKAHINSLEPIRPPDELRSKMLPTYPMGLIYTSGSTGFPKAISFSVGRTLPFAGRRVNGYSIRAGPNGDRYYVCMPMYHGTGGTVAFNCLLSGITLCIGKRFSTSRFWDDVRESRATAMVYVGETARYLLSAPPSPRDRDHNVRVAFGNGLRPDVWKKFQDRFGIDTVAEFFNSTEGVFGTVNIVRGPYLQGAVGHHGFILRKYFEWYYCSAKVDIDTGELWRDPETGFGKLTSLEEGGEIVVQVPDESLFPGYWGNKKATDKKFERNLIKKGDLWYRTGDALRRTKDGHWYFMDRLGDTYRWKSENVATMEVQEKLGRFPGLSEAAVYGVLVPGHDGRAGCAAIHLEPPNRPTPDFFAALMKYAQEQLPKYAIPVFLRVLNEFKPMHNQKQNKIPLKKDEINLDAIYGPGKDLDEARTDGKDTMYWWPGSLGFPQPDGLDTYVPFRREDWELVKGKGLEQARL